MEKEELRHRNTKEWGRREENACKNSIVFAIQPIIESTNLIICVRPSCCITSNLNIEAHLTWGCKFIQIPANQATAKQEKIAKARQSISDLKLLLLLFPD